MRVQPGPSGLINGVVGPELRSQFFPAHHFPRAFEQQTQDLESLLSHLHFRPELPQLTGAQIDVTQAVVLVTSLGLNVRPDAPE